MTDYEELARRNMVNPFDPFADRERHSLWERVIVADSEAFLAGDWSAIEGDFDADQFEGIRCYESTHAEAWRITFPTLESYRQSWLEASRQFRGRRFAGLTHRQALYARTHLTQIEISGKRALCHKRFFGDLPLEDGTMLTASRQTLYRLHRRSASWKIVGFLGQLPLAVVHEGQS